MDFGALPPGSVGASMEYGALPAGSVSASMDFGVLPPGSVGASMEYENTEFGTEFKYLGVGPTLDIGWGAPGVVVAKSGTRGVSVDVHNIGCFSEHARFVKYSDLERVVRDRNDSHDA